MKSSPFVQVTIFSFLLKSVTYAQGSIQLYLDDDCTDPTGAAISLGAGVCYNTDQAVAVALVSFPPCASGQPILTISDYSDCERPSITPLVSSGNIGHCLSFPTGSDIGSAAFQCVGEITTVPDSPPDTTPSSNPPTSIPSSSTTTTPPLKGTASSNPPVSIHTSSTTTTPAAITQSSTQPSQSSSSSGGGLGISDKIALGCGIGLGLPALFFAALTWWNNWWEIRESRTHPQLHFIPPRIQLGDPPPYHRYELRPLGNRAV
jgi:hypothetical protein